MSKYAILINNVVTGELADSEPMVNALDLPARELELLYFARLYRTTPPMKPAGSPAEAAQQELVNSLLDAIVELMLQRLVVDDRDVPLIDPHDAMTTLNLPVPAGSTESEGLMIKQVRLVAQQLIKMVVRDLTFDGCDLYKGFQRWMRAVMKAASRPAVSRFQTPAAMLTTAAGHEAVLKEFSTPERELDRLNDTIADLSGPYAARVRNSSAVILDALEREGDAGAATRAELEDKLPGLDTQVRQQLAGVMSEGLERIRRIWPKADVPA